MPRPRGCLMRFLERIAVSGPTPKGTNTTTIRKKNKPKPKATPCPCREPQITQEQCDHRKASSLSDGPTSVAANGVRSRGCGLIQPKVDMGGNDGYAAVCEVLVADEVTEKLDGKAVERNCRLVEEQDFAVDDTEPREGRRGVFCPADKEPAKRSRRSARSNQSPNCVRHGVGVNISPECEVFAHGQRRFDAVGVAGIGSLIGGKVAGPRNRLLQSRERAQECCFCRCR